MKAKTLVNIACLSTCLILPNLTYAIDYKGPLKKDATHEFKLVCGSPFPTAHLSVNGPTTATGYPLDLKAQGINIDERTMNCGEYSMTLYAPGNLTAPGVPSGYYCAWDLTVHNASGGDIEHVDLDARCLP